MFEMTRDFEEWLFNNHKELLVPLTFGHTELLTEDLIDEYLNSKDKR